MPPRYRVEFTKSAKREFDRLQKRLQDKVIEGLEILSNNPFSELLKVKKLKGADSLYRFRVGDWRVVYEVRREVLIVLVIKIGHRGEVYRNL